MERVICFAAGVAEGDPGPATIEVSIQDAAGTVLHEVTQSIGNGSSDYAAYQAVLVGLESLVRLFGEDTHNITIELRLLNQMVKKQLNAEVPVTNPGYVPLFMAIHNLRVEHFPILVLV